MLPTGNASPLTGAPGAVLLYALAGLMLWPRRATDARPAAAGGILGPIGARIAWAALWLGAAALWLLPANRQAGAVHDAIVAAPSGAGWLTAVHRVAAAAAAGHGGEIAIALAVVSAVIGIAVLWNRSPASFLVVGSLLSLGYWLIGEGLGGIFTGSATDPNTGPLLVLLAASLYAGRPSRNRGGEWASLLPFESTATRSPRPGVEINGAPGSDRGRDDPIGDAHVSTAAHCIRSCAPIMGLR